MDVGLPLTIVVGGALLFRLVQAQARLRRARPLLAEAAAAPVLFRDRVSVRTRRPGRWGTWSDVKRGPNLPIELICRQGYVEVAFAGKTRDTGASLGCEWVLSAGRTTMTQQEIGWLGTQLLRRASVVLRNDGDDPSGAIELAVCPRDGADLWSHLRSAGVQPG